MSDFQGRESFVIEQAFDATSATNKQGLGTIVRAFDTATTAQGMGEFIYLEGVASTAVGTWVTYNADAWTTAHLGAGSIGEVAISMSANVASQFGWYQISGKAVGGCQTSMADNARVWATASGAGLVDNASVEGDLVFNAVAASTTTAGTFVCDFEIGRPHVDDGQGASN